MRHILHKIALSPYTALSPIGPHCVPMGLNPSVVSFFFCSGRRRRLPPRPLCGSDPMQPEGPLAKVISIHAPRVGSDLTTGALPSWAVYFNPRSPCGERPRRGQGLGRGVDISIHAPRVGSDLALIFSIAPILISIHAPRVGSDPCIHERFPTPDNFNPRSPCGERLKSDLISRIE